MDTQNTAKQSTSGPGNAEFEKVLAGLPLTTYRAGETVLTAGSKSGRLLILKKGAVVILKDSIEIARVERPGAVLGEISALLEEPHAADVRTLEDSQFHVADAALLAKDPIIVLHVTKILARRLLTADEYLVELKKQLHAGQTLNALSKLADKIQVVFLSSADQPLRGRYY